MRVYNNHRKKPGYEFGYTPFEELPPAKVTVVEEVIISEIGEAEVLITHDEPTCKKRHLWWSYH